MIRHITLVSAFLILQLATTQLWAQASATEPESQPRAKEQQEPKTPEGKPAPPESKDSPFDYEASEQISEDLSVSFPVDI